MKRLILTLAVLMLAAGTANAIPELQVYIEGATYDMATETWVIQTTGTFRLWAVGNVGAKGTISDVRLSAAYSSAYAPTISLTGTNADGLDGVWTDPSDASNPTYIQTVTDGSAPLLSDGSALPGHGIYGAGTHWQEFALGDMTLTDSYIADFIGTDPIAPTTQVGQINVYEVTVSGIPVGGTVHFDLYNSYYNTQGPHAVFAPFSHDGETTNVPEPGTIALLGMGAAGLGFRLRRRVRK